MDRKQKEMKTQATDCAKELEGKCIVESRLDKIKIRIRGIKNKRRLPEDFVMWRQKGEIIIYCDSKRFEEVPLRSFIIGTGFVDTYDNTTLTLRTWNG